jgi:hypothetical protein
MKILYFTRDYTPHDRRFLEALSTTEHQVFYLQLERRGHLLEDRPLPPRIERVPWAGGSQPFHRRSIPRLLPSLKQVIHDCQPDLLHAGPLQTAGLLAAMTGFRPLVSMSWEGTADRRRAQRLQPLDHPVYPQPQRSDGR